MAPRRGLCLSTTQALACSNGCNISRSSASIKSSGNRTRSTLCLAGVSAWRSPTFTDAASRTRWWQRAKTQT